MLGLRGEASAFTLLSRDAEMDSGKPCVLALSTKTMNVHLPGVRPVMSATI